MIYPRLITKKIVERLSDPDILILVGARQVGKTTILRQIKESLSAQGERTEFINLEDLEYVKLLDESPKNLFKIIALPEQKKIFVFVDEIQYLENPTNFLKYIYDEFKDKVKLIVSGSSAFYIDEKFKDSLAGRKIIFPVHTLSLPEMLIFQGHENLAEKTAFKIRAKDIFLEELPLKEKEKVSACINSLLIFGGYPRVVLEKDVSRKKEIIEEIALSYIKKDVLEANIKRVNKFYELFKLLSSQAGSLLNVNELSNTLNISQTSLNNYLHVMRKSFHIVLIRPFYKNLRKELTKMPKVYFMDLGLKNFFLKDFTPLASRENPGPLYENFIFKQFAELFSPDDIRFWRTQSGNEADFILNDKTACEVKFNINNFSAAKYKMFLNSYADFTLNVIYHTGIVKDNALKDKRFNFIKL
ncbi:MAG: AAA family ATPase [Candidatus Omnitrophica bacterium]|nr:AAA family ATPase [Candidatus Omnitrophota bacterium]